MSFCCLLDFRVSDEHSALNVSMTLCVMSHISLSVLKILFVFFFKNVILLCLDVDLFENTQLWFHCTSGMCWLILFKLNLGGFGSGFFMLFLYLSLSLLLLGSHYAYSGVLVGIPQASVCCFTSFFFFLKIRWSYLTYF